MLKNHHFYLKLPLLFCVSAYSALAQSTIWVTPNPGIAGSSFTFYADSTSPMDTRSPKIRIYDGSNYFEHFMTKVTSTKYSYTNVISVAGNRKYTIGLNINGSYQWTPEQFYTVQSAPTPTPTPTSAPTPTVTPAMDNPPTVTINTSGGGGNNPKTTNFDLNVSVVDDIGLKAVAYEVLTSSFAKTGQIGSVNLTGKNGSATFPINVDSLAVGDYKIQVLASDTKPQPSTTQWYWFQKTAPTPIAMPSINSPYVNPSSGQAGTNFTFYAPLSSDLPNGYSVNIEFWDDGAWKFRQPMAKYDSTTYFLTKNITLAGNRQFRVAIFNGTSPISSWINGSYTVTEIPVKHPPVASKYSAPSSSKVGESITVQIKATDPDNDLANVQIDWGDSSGDLCEQQSEVLFACTHTYQRAGAFTWRAWSYDNGSPKLNSDSVQGVVTVATAPVVTKPVTPDNKAPSAPVISVPNNIIKGQAATFSLQAGNDPENGSVSVQCKTSAGDPYESLERAGAITHTTTFSFVPAGNYSISCVTVDDKGARSAVATENFMVGESVLPIIPIVNNPDINSTISNNLDIYFSDMLLEDEQGNTIRISANLEFTGNDSDGMPTWRLKDYQVLQDTPSIDGDINIPRVLSDLEINIPFIKQIPQAKAVNTNPKLFSANLTFVGTPSTLYKWKLKYYSEPKVKSCNFPNDLKPSAGGFLVKNPNCQQLWDWWHFNNLGRKLLRYDFDTLYSQFKGVLNRDEINERNLKVAQSMIDIVNLGGAIETGVAEKIAVELSSVVKSNLTRYISTDDVWANALFSINDAIAKSVLSYVKATIEGSISPVGAILDIAPDTAGVIMKFMAAYDVFDLQKKMNSINIATEFLEKFYQYGEDRNKVVRHFLCPKDYSKCTPDMFTEWFPIITGVAKSLQLNNNWYYYGDDYNPNEVKDMIITYRHKVIPELTSISLKN